MKKILASIEDDCLKVYVIWMTAFARDSRGAAATREKELTDNRVRHYWDGKNASGGSWMATLNIPMPAWDVYFLFNANTVWQDIAPRPDFLLHQLGKALPKENHLLNSGGVQRFEQKTRALLEAIH